MDVAGSTETIGQDFMEKGLLVSITEQPGAVLIVHERLE